MPEQTPIAVQPDKKLPTQCAVLRLDLTLTKLNALMSEGLPLKFKAGMKPTPSQMDTIKQTIEAAKQSLLLPATADEIAAQFSLLSGGMRLPKDMDSENAAQAYMIALDGFPSFAIRQSIVNIIRGKAEGFNKTFMPAAPELAMYCEQLEQAQWRKIESVERRLDAPEEQAGGASISAEKFDELREKFNQVKGEAA